MSELLINGNAVHIPLASESVHCVITSPPYWGLRDYGLDERGLGLEPMLEEYIANMVAVFREVRRVLRPDGTLWLNIGDSYAGSGGIGNQRDDANKGNMAKFKNPNSYVITNSKRMERGSGRWGGGNLPARGDLKPKDLIGIPWRLALALQAEGWWLRSDIIWSKPNPMPESVTDRPTKSHEYLFLLSKSARYFYDQDAIREQTIPDPRDSLWGQTKVTSYHDHSHDLEMGMSQIRTQADGFFRMSNPAGKNRRTVWEIATQPYSGAHFATFPPALVEPCIKTGSSEKGCCPICGSPWKRMTQGGNPSKWAADNDIRDFNNDGRTANPQSSKSLHRNGTGVYYSKTITGWQPTCDHDADPIPATVLDPFCGTGTTLMVARQLGRNSIGIDLSYPYLHDQARSRLQLDALEAWRLGKGRKDGASVADLPLFVAEKPLDESGRNKDA